VKFYSNNDKVHHWAKGETLAHRRDPTEQDDDEDDESDLDEDFDYESAVREC
jgi:hypothetical protein